MQTFSTNDKQVISYPHLTLKEGPKLLITLEDSQPMTSYMLVSQAKVDVGTFKVCHKGYFGTPWMTLNEELQGQMSPSL